MSLVGLYKATSHFSQSVVVMAYNEKPPPAFLPIFMWGSFAFFGVIVIIMFINMIIEDEFFRNLLFFWRRPGRQGQDKDKQQKITLDKAKAKKGEKDP